MKLFLSPEEATALLPDYDSIHTFYNTSFGLVGADWERNDVIAKIMSCDFREITGNTARGMKHGLALYNAGCFQDDIVFVETNMATLNRLYPEESE